MNNKLVLITLFAILISALVVNGQNPRLPRKPESKPKFETVSMADKITGDIMLGNIGFFNGLFLSSKLTAGYKLGNRVVVGGGFKLFYNEYQLAGFSNPKIFDYGGLLYSRIKVYGGFYVQGEYAFMTYDKVPQFVFDPTRDPILKTNANSPLLGVGYLSGYDKWAFGAQILYIFDETSRDIQNSIVEYWFGATYNF